MPKPLPSQDDLRALFDYDPSTGKLYWKVRTPEWFPDYVMKGASISAELAASRWNNTFAGKEAFTTQHERGYFRGTLLKTSYRAHRLIYKWWHGDDPVTVDHINGDTSDNRIANLRSVTHQQNMMNMRCHRAA